MHQYPGNPHPIRSLPASCWQLRGLERLTMSLSSLAQPLSAELANLSSLRYLFIEFREDSLDALRESLPWLSHLEELRLICPDVREFPNFFELHRLEKLRRLTVEASSLRAMPEFLVRMGYLMGQEGNALGLEELTLTYFHPKLAGAHVRSELRSLLAGLRSLTLAHCPGFLPNRIGSPTLLEELHLEKCRDFEYFPEALSSLVALKLLRVSGCLSLDTFPRMLSSCSRLEELNVDQCGMLTRLPEDLGDIPSLRKVHLRDLVRLERLPSLVHARGLKQLIVLNCTEVVLPSGLLDLPNLEEDSRRLLRQEMRRAR